MAYADGRYWITYNGELYNFRELRAELERDGLSDSASDCDTEVLLAMYARDGARHARRGSTGSSRSRSGTPSADELFLARDRLGVKPLYYAAHGGLLAFASELKALLPRSPRPGMNRRALAEYLTFLWVPDPETLFEGVQKLPGGPLRATSRGRPADPRVLGHDASRRRTAAERASGATGRADRRRRRPAPDGLRRPARRLPSGGMDSSAIVAEMSGAAERVTTYTVGFTAADLAHEIVPDDLATRARSAQRVRRSSTTSGSSRPDIVDLLPKLVWHLDEPVADPAAITTYLICAAARERLTVMLGGMGGDEIFAGYPRYLAAQPRPDRSTLLPLRLRAGGRERARARG